MEIITSSDIPQSLEGFIGGMGAKSIQHITESELGFEGDVKGYISQVDDNGYYYAEVLDGDCYLAKYARSKDIADLQKWLTDEIYNYFS